MIDMSRVPGPVLAKRVKKARGLFRWVQYRRKKLERGKFLLQLMKPSLSTPNTIPQFVNPRAITRFCTSRVTLAKRCLSHWQDLLDTSQKHSRTADLHYMTRYSIPIQK